MRFRPWEKIKQLGGSTIPWACRSVSLAEICRQGRVVVGEDGSEILHKYKFHSLCSLAGVEVKSAFRDCICSPPIDVLHRWRGDNFQAKNDERWFILSLPNARRAELVCVVVSSPCWIRAAYTKRSSFIKMRYCLILKASPQPPKFKLRLCYTSSFQMKRSVLFVFRGFNVLD